MADYAHICVCIGKLILVYLLAVRHALNTDCASDRTRATTGGILSPRTSEFRSESIAFPWAVSLTHGSRIHPRD